MNDGQRLSMILRADPFRWHLLGVVAELELPDCWIAAGFVRNVVWDNLHGREPMPPQGDVDVIWHDPDRTAREIDLRLEEQLARRAPTVEWSVKNQARMHRRNNDAPYRSSVDAMRYWPETATAVAVRRQSSDICEVAAPLGLDDLFGLILRPTPSFSDHKRSIFDERLRAKDWIKIWPFLKLEEPQIVEPR